MGTSRIILTLFIVFFSVLSFAAAAEDFTATGTARILSSACSPAAGTITVTNTGDLPSTYTLTPEGEAKDWVVFVPDAFSLFPGKSQTVEEYFAIPCDAEDQFLDVVIATPDLELILNQDIIVQPPNNLVLLPQVYSQAILPCETALFSFLLHNPADFPETYMMKVMDAPQQTTLSDEELTLLPETNQTIEIAVRPKDCTLAGEFAPVLVVKTEKSRLAAEIEMFLRINDTHIPEIAEGINRIRAGLAPQEAPFEIFNRGDRITTYTLRVDGPDWARVQPDQITVDPRDSETVKFVIQPTSTTAQGSYQVALTARVEATGREYTKDFTLVLREPNLMDKLFRDYLVYTIAGIVIIIALILLIIAGVKKYNSPAFQAKLAERSAARERLRQERIALKEARRKEHEEKRAREEERERKEEEVEARDAERQERQLERERLKAQRDYDKQLRKEHLVIPKDDIIAGFKLPGKRLWKLALLVLVLIILGIVLSFRQAFTQNSNAVLTGIIVLLALLVIHRIRRRRSVRKRWKLALANQDLHFLTSWKKGLTNLSFRLNTVIKKLVVRVKRCKPSVPSPSKHTYRTFAITANVDTNVVSDARLTFSIKKSWLLRRRIAPSDVKLVRLEDGRWQNIAVEPVSADGKYVHFVADADGFGEYAIVGKPGRQVAKPARPWGRWIGLTVFGAIAVVALIALLVLVPDRTPTVGIPAQVWKQDDQHTLNLGEYFKDPDNDKLTFSATRTENIDIQFLGDKALLVPSYGWSGRERAVFIADDGKGGVVKSNPVDLVVEAPVIPSVWKRYAHVILVLAVPFLIIFGLMLFGKPLKKLIGLE